MLISVIIMINVIQSFGEGKGFINLNCFVVLIFVLLILKFILFNCNFKTGFPAFWLLPKKQ